LQDVLADDEEIQPPSPHLLLELPSYLKTPPTVYQERPMAQQITKKPSVDTAGATHWIGLSNASLLSALASSFHFFQVFLAS
jgi:hypothetical protein